MTSGQLAALDSNIFAIITKLKRQPKRTDIDSIHANIIKTVDFEEITIGNFQEKMNNLISDGKVINKSNQNKVSYEINLNLDITTESTWIFSHDFLPSTPTAAHDDLLPSPTSHL